MRQSWAWRKNQASDVTEAALLAPGRLGSEAQCLPVPRLLGRCTLTEQRLTQLPEAELDFLLSASPSLETSAPLLGDAHQSSTDNHKQQK